MGNETGVTLGSKGGNRPSSTVQSLVLDCNQAGALLNCSPRTVIRLTKKGELSSLRVGALRRWSLKSIEQFIERQTRKETKP